MKPILFNTEMVRAILEGRKTVTRRVVKSKALDGLSVEGMLKRAPYKVGDVLYVRETWGCYPESWGNASYFMYRADFPDGANKYMCSGVECDLPKWRPSIHMPKEAARIFLRVTDVRLERLQDMTLDDFANEGITIDEDETLRELNLFDEANSLAKSKFIQLWDSTLDRKSCANCWSANPYVWVIEFEVIDKPEEG